MEFPEGHSNLLSIYEESPKHRKAERYTKGKYIIEKKNNGNLYGCLRILKYYPGLEKFGVIVDWQELHNKLFDHGLKNMSKEQFERTMELYEESDTHYFWTFIKERHDEIWKTEEDLEREAEILEHLSKL